MNFKKLFLHIKLEYMNLAEKINIFNNYRGLGQNTKNGENHYF